MTTPDPTLSNVDREKVFHAALSYVENNDDGSAMLDSVPLSPLSGQRMPESQEKLRIANEFLTAREFALVKIIDLFRAHLEARRKARQS